LKIKFIKIANLIFAVVIALFVVGYTFAWFSNEKQAEEYENFSGIANGGYFAGGNGTSTNPFFITKIEHLYNLSMLQNNGRLKGHKYYFKLGNDIEMNNDLTDTTVIAPIGNDKYKFNGVFNGAGHTITNLVVSTNKNVLRSTDPARAEDYEFSNAVGLFGMTDGGSEIKNFILDDPIIEVADSGTLYSDVSSDSSDSSNTQSSPKTVGIAIGYVAGSASYIGVAEGSLSVQRSGYTTKNSIVGFISKYTAETGTISTTVPSSGTGGDTGHFIPGAIITKAENPSSSSNHLLTTYDSSGKNVKTKGIFSSSSISYNKNSTDENVSLSTGIWVVSSNGYYTDNGTTTLIKNSDDYLGLGCFSFVVQNTTSISYKAPPLKKTATKIKILKPSSSTTDEANEICTISYDSTNNLWATTDGNKYYNSSYKVTWNSILSDPSKMIGVNDKDGNYVIPGFDYSFYFEKTDQNQGGDYQVLDENGSLYDSVTSSTVYGNTIMVNIKNTSNAKVFVVAGSRSEKYTRSLGISKIVDASDLKTTSNNYLDGDVDFYFRNNYSNFTSTSTTTSTINVISVKGAAPKDSNKHLILPNSKDYIYACTFDLSSSGAGIYAIGSSNSGINIYYLAVTGVDGDYGSTSSNTYEKNIENIDFVKTSGTITEENGSYSFSDYVATGVLVEFTNDNAALILFFHRDDNSMRVDYYGSDIPTFSDKTISGIKPNDSGLTISNNNGKVEVSKPGTYSWTSSS
jgi:hypothetical protein